MSGPGDDPTTQELRALQDRRAEAEAERADTAPLEDEALAAARRSDKAAYLRDKLDEQAEALGE